MKEFLCTNFDPSAFHKCCCWTVFSSLSPQAASIWYLQFCRKSSIFILLSIMLSSLGAPCAQSKSSCLWKLIVAVQRNLKLRGPIFLRLNTVPSKLGAAILCLAHASPWWWLPLPWLCLHSIYQKRSEISGICMANFLVSVLM